MEGAHDRLPDELERRVSDPLERRVLEAVDLEKLLRFLDELVSIPSVAGEETPAQEAVATEMESAGLSTDVWELDFEGLRRHPAYAVDVERERGLGVTGSLGGGGGPTLVLNGHVDVVTAGDPARWSYDPWRATLAGDRVHGRGTADMKGGLCCALFAARAIAAAGVRLRGTLRIQSVIGEEDGGVGTLAAILRDPGGDGAVVLEPTRLAVAPAQAGALSFRVTVPGRAAHGAFREEGVDPVERFFAIHRRLRRLEEERNRNVADPLFADEALPFALAVGIVRAGDWASTVAESLVFEGRYGIAPGEDAAAARAAFEAAVAEAAEAAAIGAAAGPAAGAASADVDADAAWLRAHPPAVEWVGARFDAARTPSDARVVGTLAGAYEDVTGVPAEVRGMRYGADMRLLVNEAGIPTVLFGPGDVRVAHRPDEGVAVDDLLRATRALALAALRFCGVEEG